MRNIQKLKTLVGIISGYPFESSLFNTEGQGLPLIRVRDVNSGFAGLYYAGDYDDNFLIQNGDLLIGLDGDFKCVEWRYGKALLNQRVCKIIPKNDKINKRYLLHFLPAALSQIHKNTNFTTVKHLSTKTILEIQIPAITLSGQQQIANILSRAENLLDQRKESIRLLDEFLKSTFLEIFGDPVRNKKGWEKVSLSKLGKLDRGVSKNRPRNSPELLGGIYPLIQTGDISNAGLFIDTFTQTYSELGMKQSKMWNKGTLCITIAANIGKTGILKFDACFPDSVVGFITDENEANTVYVYYLFSFLQKILEKNAPQAAQKNINLALLRNLPVPLPPLSLQSDFAILVYKTETLKVQYQSSLQELENLYNSLSQKAFKGEMNKKDEEMIMAAESRVEYYKR